MLGSSLTAAKIRREAEFSRSVVVMGWRLIPFGEGKKEINSLFNLKVQRGLVCLPCLCGCLILIASHFVHGEN